MSTSQVDVLWHCLVCDSERSDDTLEWFLQQAQSKEFHALDASALQYIFTEKVAYLQRLLRHFELLNTTFYAIKALKYLHDLT